MGSLLLLSPEVRDEVDSLASAGYPDETCGLLLGREIGGHCTVLAQRAARNVINDRSGDRFAIDPVDYLAAENAAAGRGMSLVGVWHSHPDHPAFPSETDREMAWPDWSYLIVAVNARGVVDWRSWRLAGARFSEEEVRDG